MNTSAAQSISPVAQVAITTIKVVTSQSRRWSQHHARSPWIVWMSPVIMCSRARPMHVVPGYRTCFLHSCQSLASFSSFFCFFIEPRVQWVLKNRGCFLRIFSGNFQKTFQTSRKIWVKKGLYYRSIFFRSI